MMKSRRLPVVSALLATAMLLCIFLPSCGKGKSSKPSASEYLEKIFEATFSKDEPEATNLKTEISYLPVSGSEGFGKTELVLYSGTSGESVVCLDSSFGGAPADLELYCGGTTVTVISSLIGDSPIGATAEQLEALMKLYDPEKAPSVSSGLLYSFAEDNAKKIEKLAEKYFELISSSVEKATENKVTLKDETVTVDLEFNCDGAKKLIKDVFDKAKKDTELRQLFEKLMIASGLTGEALNEALDGYNELFSSNEALDELFADMNECDVSAKVSFKADALYNLKAMSAEISMKNETAFVGFEVSDPDRITLAASNSFTDPETKEEYSESVTYTFATENNGGTKVYKGICKIETSYEELEQELYTLTVSENGEFTLNASVMGAACGISGTASSENGKHTAVISGYSFNGDARTVNITVTIEKDVQLPEFPTDYKSVNSLTTEEIKGIMNSVKAHPLAQMLSGIMKGAVSPDVENEG